MSFFITAGSLSNPQVEVLADTSLKRKDFGNFLANFLYQDYKQRKNATELLQHPFILKKSEREDIYSCIKSGDLKHLETIMGGYSVNFTGSCHIKSPLTCAASEGKTEFVKTLVEKGNAYLDFEDDGGNTALIIAARSGNLDIVKYLIEAGSNVDVELQRGKGSALYWACGTGQVAMVKYLVEQGGAAVNRTLGSESSTEVHAACSEGHLEVLKYLLSKGARVEVADSDGHTPLHMASHSGHLQVVKHLVGAGADAGAKDKKGRTAKDLVEASKKDKPEHQAVLRYLEQVCRS